MTDNAADLFGRSGDRATVLARIRVALTVARLGGEERLADAVMGAVVDELLGERDGARETAAALRRAARGASAEAERWRVEAGAWRAEAVAALGLLGLPVVERSGNTVNGEPVDGEAAR